MNTSSKLFKKNKILNKSIWELFKLASLNLVQYGFW